MMSPVLTARPYSAPFVWLLAASLGSGCLPRREVPLPEAAEGHLLVLYRVDALREELIVHGSSGLLSVSTSESDELVLFIVPAESAQAQGLASRYVGPVPTTGREVPPDATAYTLAGDDELWRPTDARALRARIRIPGTVVDCSADCCLDIVRAPVTAPPGLANINLTAVALSGPNRLILGTRKNNGVIRVDIPSGGIRERAPSAFKVDVQLNKPLTVERRGDAVFIGGEDGSVAETDLEGNFVRLITGGSSGLYLAEGNGPVLGYVRGGRAFEVVASSTVVVWRHDIPSPVYALAHDGARIGALGATMLWVFEGREWSATPLPAALRPAELNPTSSRPIARWLGEQLIIGIVGFAARYVDGRIEALPVPTDYETRSIAQVGDRILLGGRTPLRGELVVLGPGGTPCTLAQGTPINAFEEKLSEETIFGVTSKGMTAPFLLEISDGATDN